MPTHHTVQLVGDTQQLLLRSLNISLLSIAPLYNTVGDSFATSAFLCVADAPSSRSLTDQLVHFWSGTNNIGAAAQEELSLVTATTQV